jgi:uncharacterized protein YjbI with pentapeptide repeats
MSTKIHEEKRRLDISRSDISGSVLDDVNLSGCRFDDCNMAGWRIHDVNLSGLKIENANLAGAAIANCRIEGMSIDGVPVVDLLAIYRAANSGTANEGVV